MYFIFKHTDFSRYKDRKGKFYHYDERSPNFEKVREKAKVLCYQKEDNWIFAIATVGKIRVVKKKVKNFFAFYGKYLRLGNPLFLDYETRKRVGLKRNLELPSPGIVPIEKGTYEKLLKMIRKENKIFE